jgi:thiol-disulfide isomerase/thioredoxin
LASLAVPAQKRKTGPAKSPTKSPTKSHKPIVVSAIDTDALKQLISEQRERPLLVNFWATWCDPCRDEMPSIKALQQRLAGRPFTVVAVNHGESAQRVQEFVRRLALEFRVLLDPNQDAARAWQVRVLPASFLVGPDGRVRYRVIGEIDWATAVAVETVTRLLP